MSDPAPGNEGLTVEQLQAELDGLKSTNKRLLDESAKNRELYKTAKASLDEAEKAKLEAKGEVEKLLEKERADNAKLRSDYETLAQKAVRKELKAEVAKVAKDAHDVDDLLTVKSHSDLIKFDMENLSVSGVEDFVKKVREEKPHYFSKSALPPTDNERPPADNLPPSTDEENYLRELKATKTQKEFDAVRKKYGKD